MRGSESAGMAPLLRMGTQRPKQRLVSHERKVEVALVAVRQSGFALGVAAAELKSDREIALAAVCQSGKALRCVAAELKGRRKIALAAVG